MNSTIELVELVACSPGVPGEGVIFGVEVFDEIFGLCPTYALMKRSCCSTVGYLLASQAYDITGS